jgi:hypothetical protein
MPDHREARAPAPVPGLHSAPPSSQTAARAPSLGGGPGGPDIGWALACAGLLLAAGILGLTNDGRKATASGRTRLAGALRPLLGRR